MKKLSFIFALLTLASCSSGNLTGEEYRKVFPKYEAVLTHIKPFVASIADEYIMEITKTPKGYFLLLLSNDHPNVVKKEIKIWDYETKNFTNISHLKKTAYSDQNAQNQLYSLLKRNKEMFDLMLFYGYPGWIKDTKTLLEKQDEKSLWELEVLSRTYSSEAQNTLFPGNFESFERGKDFTQVGYGEISAQAKKEFNELSEKSLACLYEIQKRDPKYSTFRIEDIRLKINHDLMNSYLSMLIVKDENSAKKYMDRVKYPEWMLKIAARYLGECDPDAFFFCYGDGDTFPTMYLQAFKKLRPDVKIINLSLLQTGRYNQMICDRLKLKSPFTYEQFPDLANIYLTSQEGEIKNISEMNNALIIASQSRKKPGYNYVNLSSSFVIEIFGKEKAIYYSGYTNDLSDAVLLNLLKDYPQGKFHFSSPAAFQKLGFMSEKESIGISAYWQMAGLTQNLRDRPADKARTMQNLIELTNFNQKTMDEMKYHGSTILREIRNFYLTLDEGERLKYGSLFKLTKQKYDAVGFLKSGDIEKFSILSEFSARPSWLKMESHLKKWIEDLPMDYNSFESSQTKIRYLRWMCGSTNVEWSKSDFKASARILSYLNQKLVKLRNNGSLKLYFWTSETLDKMIMDLQQTIDLLDRT